LPPDVRGGPAGWPELNLNEPDMQKHTVEVRIGRDDDDRWWVMVIVDANDDAAVWCGPYEDQEAAEKEGLALATKLTVSMTKASGASSPRGACHQLGTDAGNRS